MKKSFIFAAIIVLLSATGSGAFSQDSGFQRLQYIKEKLMETQSKIADMQKKIDEKYKPVKSEYVNNLIGQPIAFFTTFQNSFNSMFSAISSTIENPTMDKLEQCWTFFSKTKPELQALLTQFENTAKVVQGIDLDKIKKQLSLFEYPKALKNLKLAIETSLVSITGVKQMIDGIAGGSKHVEKGERSVEPVSAGEQ
jgi:cytochrome c556